MRIHLRYAAKLAAVVGVALVIMPTLGFHAEGSLKRAPYVAGSVELDVVRDAGDNARRTVPAGSVTRCGIPWAQHEARPRRMESDSSVAGGSDRRPVKVTAGSADLTLSSIGDELKATITLLQAFSRWIRLSPQAASNSLG